MDISNLNANAPGDRRVKGGSAGGADEATSAQSTPRAADGDQVQWSHEAQSIREAADSAAQQAPFDAERVAAIRDAIAEGRYHVDPERLAERFMDLELQLIQ